MRSFGRPFRWIAAVSVLGLICLVGLLAGAPSAAIAPGSSLAYPAPDQMVFLPLAIRAYGSGDIVWASRANLPTARGNLGAATNDGKVYAIGGSGSGGYLATVEEYDPQTDQWTTRTGIPTPRGSMGVAAWNDRIYVIGGSTGSGPAPSAGLAIVEEGTIRP